MHELLGQLSAVIFEYKIGPDNRGEFTYISQAAENILGVPAELLLNNEVDINTLIHPEDISFFYSTLTTWPEGKKEWLWNGRMIVGSAQRWMEWRASIEYINHDKILKGFI